MGGELLDQYDIYILAIKAERLRAVNSAFIEGWHLHKVSSEDPFFCMNEFVDVISSWSCVFTLHCHSMQTGTPFWIGDNQLHVIFAAEEGKSVFSALDKSSTHNACSGNLD